MQLRLQSEQQELGRIYEIKNVPCSVCVKGRWRKSSRQWQEINAPQFVLEIIEFGYK